MADERPDDAKMVMIDRRAVRRSFSRSAASYDGAAVLQKEIGTRMAERLDVVRLEPRAILDAGCGTGDALSELAARYPKARRVAVDVALPMLGFARERWRSGASILTRLLAPMRQGAGSAPGFVCADLTALPFRAAAFDLVWSNATLQWVGDLPTAFAECHRVLAVGGLFTFTTFGPDTLKELRAAFASVDSRPHVGRFVDMHDIGDLLLAAGFADPVMQMEYTSLTYADATAQIRDLKAIGATNAAPGRARGLMSRGRWTRAVAALEARRSADTGRINATFEVIYGHAWKPAPRQTADGRAIVTFERERKRV